MACKKVGERWVERLSGRKGMERKAVVVCALVGFLGVLSAALGFAAEGTRVKVNRPVRPRPTQQSPAHLAGKTAPFALLCLLLRLRVASRSRSPATPPPTEKKRR